MYTLLNHLLAFSNRLGVHNPSEHGVFTDQFFFLEQTVRVSQTNQPVLQT